VGGVITGSSVSVTGAQSAASTVGGVITGTSTSVTGTTTAASVVGGVITGTSLSVTGNISTADSSSLIAGRLRIASNATGGFINQVDNSVLYIGANSFYPLTIAAGTSSATSNISIASNLSVTGNVTGVNHFGTSTSVTGTTTAASVSLVE
jgi:hypothetical protein